MRPVGPGTTSDGDAESGPPVAERPEESADRHTKAMIKLDPVSRYEGEIDFPGDVDWIRFDAIAFAAYEIRVFRSSTASYGALKPRFETAQTVGNSLRHGTLPDPVILGVYDDGNQILNTDDNDNGYGRNSEVTFRTASVPA